MQLYLAVMQQQLERMRDDRLYYDLLTNLPNRLFIYHYLTLALAKLDSEAGMLAAIVLDLDRFKNVNDSLGHGSGDRILQAIAQRLQTVVPPTGIIGRWSGDEFMLLVPGLERISAVTEIADRLLDCFDRPFALVPGEAVSTAESVYVKASIGIAVAADRHVASDSLLRDADTALSYAKQNGKNNYQIYNTTIVPAPIDPFQLEHILYRAIDEEQLILHYQPQLCLTTGKIIGVESLLRCQNLYERSIGPDLFIPIAEATGSILPIGEWVLRTACQQNKRWQELGLGYFPIAINFSLGQLQAPNSIDRIISILAETGVAPKYLEIEITESTAVENLQLTIAILESLRQIGVKISLDDFGTGYSSLAVLKYLPLDRLKLDRLFIQELRANTVDAEIVKTIINLAHELKLSTVAEGVETTEQLECLRSLGCDAVQGFFISRPLPAIDLERSLGRDGDWRDCDD